MYNKNLRINIFDVLSRPILVIDLNYRIVDANHAACTLLNLPYDQIIGQACHYLSHRNHTPCWETGEMYCPVKLSIENQRPMRVVHDHKHDASSIIEEITASPVFDEKGTLNYIIEELRDISELLPKNGALSPEKTPNNLQEFIPICAACKKIRDDNGRWQQFEDYLGNRIDAQFSHSICPDCMKARYPEFNENNTHEK